MSEKEYIFVGTAQLKTRDYIKYLEKENRDLQQRLDKAIEYIGNVLCNSKAQVRNDISGKEIDNLIEILGDKEND